MNQLRSRANETKWRRAVEIAARLIVIEGDPPLSPAELVSCIYPPRVNDQKRALTRARFYELRRALLRRLLWLEWSCGELRTVCRFDPDEIRALDREGRPTDDLSSCELKNHAESA